MIDDYIKLVIGLPIIILIGLVLKIFPYWFPKKLKNFIVFIILFWFDFRYVKDREVIEGFDTSP